MLNDRVYDDIFHNSNLPSHYCKTTDLTSMKRISLYVCVDKRCTYMNKVLYLLIFIVLYLQLRILYTIKCYINMTLTKF